MSGEMYNFLTQCERRAITQSYTRLLELIKPEELMLLLLQDGHMSNYEKSDFKFKTDNQKAQFIIDDVFLKSTYSQLLQIRKRLSQSDISGHGEIARLLPSRGEKLNAEDEMQDQEIPQQPESIQKASGVRPDTVPVTCKTVAPTDEPNPVSCEKADYSSPPGDLSISGVSGIQTSQFETVTAAEPSFSLETSSSAASMVKPAYNPQLVSRLGRYPVKAGNPQGTGEGLVVVLSNFTDDLIGYRKDRDDIKTFFQHEMKYRHVYAGKMGNKSLTNLCREEMLEVLQVVQEFLVNPMSGDGIDRFYLFLLSHGNEEGILTCKRGTTDERELDESDEPVIVTVQEIIDMFTHDKVPSLKGFPKIIFRQTCQGKEIMKNAYFPSPPSVAVHSQKAFHGRRAIGADVMICEATSPSYMSFVSDNGGSLFIQTVLQELQKHCLTDHLYDILVEVNRLISNEENKSKDATSHKQFKAVQMPDVISRLTAKLYLK